jgi:hypothetical protein
MLREILAAAVMLQFLAMIYIWLTILQGVL